MRLPEELRDRLTAAAGRHGTTVTALVERYAQEGLATDEHPGIVFQTGPSGRRAALAGGPDVWEVIAALRATAGREQDRIDEVAGEFGIHPRQVAVALGYAADQPGGIEARIEANEGALAAAERAHDARGRLLDSA